MKDLNSISVTSAAEPALKKLARAGVPVYGCKKRGAEFIFCVKDKHVKKVFAIFNKACYNIHILALSPRRSLFSALVMRAGLVAGAAVFALCAYFAGFFMLGIEVRGSGGYLEGPVKEIVFSEGGSLFLPYSKFDAPSAAAKIMSLPQVVFCDIKKNGPVLVVDVEVSRAGAQGVLGQDLLSDADGEVVEIAAVCGTPCLKAGMAVKKGDLLIAARLEESGAPCIAVGYVRLKCKKTAMCYVEDSTPQSIARAYASAAEEGEEVLFKSHKLSPSGGGFNVVMEIEYLHTISVNLN